MREALLLALGAMSGWTYWRWLVEPYWLPRYVEVPLLDLGKIGGYDAGAGWRYALPLVAVWVCYLAAWWLAGRLREGWALRALAFGGTLGLVAILLGMYPITAADVFNYLIYGLVQHWGGNPLVIEPRAIVGPPLITYSAWPFYPSPYGPLWQLISWAVTAVTGERLLAGVLGFKLVLIACHLLNVVLVERIAAASGLARPGVAALAYGWNPLLLYETAGNGHNDIVMLTGLLLALWLLLARGRAALALPAATLATLAKYVAGLWLPMLLLAGLPEDLRRWREVRWGALVAALVGCAILGVTCFAPFWAGRLTLEGVTRQADLSTTSLTSWLIAAFGREDPARVAAILDTCKIGALALLASVLIVTWPCGGGPRALIHALFDISLAYLLVGALWFQPWYLVPLVGLAPLVGAGRRLVAVVYALGATGSYVFYFYVWPALNWTPDRFVVQSWAVAVAHGPTWVVLAALGGRAVVRQVGVVRRGGG